MSEVVAILGASKNPERYSHQAFRLLQEQGHTVIPVTPKLNEIEGVATVACVADIHRHIDTLTMYVGAEKSSRLEKEIVALKPKRVIFNPGSENPSLEAKLELEGVKVIEGCTLVMLRTKQF